MTSWGTPEWDGGAPLLGYNIAIRDVTKTMWMEVGKVDANLLKFNIRDLSDNHTYMIRIYARNEIGLSEPLESDEPFKVIPGEGNNSRDMNTYLVCFIITSHIFNKRNKYLHVIIKATKELYLRTHLLMFLGRLFVVLIKIMYSSQ